MVYKHRLDILSLINLRRFLKKYVNNPLTTLKMVKQNLGNLVFECVKYIGTKKNNILNERKHEFN